MGFLYGLHHAGEGKGLHTKAELATKLGMSQASLYNKVNNVDKFTYKDIRRLCNVLKLNDEIKLALIA